MPITSNSNIDSDIQEIDESRPYFRSIKRIGVMEYYNALLDSYKQGREDQLQAASRDHKRARQESGE